MARNIILFSIVSTRFGLLPALLLLLTGALTAQTKDLRAVPIADADRASFERSRKIALLVGVAEYPNYSQIGKLVYPSNDVAVIGDLLRAQGYTVIRLADGQATREIVNSPLSSDAPEHPQVNADQDQPDDQRRQTTLQCDLQQV